MLLSYVRTIFLYLVLIAVVRLMGKRQIGEMEPAEFVVTMLVANLAAIPMQDGGIPLYSGLVPILTVLGVELLLSGLCLRCVRFRQLLCGKPVILIDNGIILRDNLRRTRVTLDELTELLRQKEILRPETVQFAILETNGNLSVFPYPAYKPAAARDVGIEPKKERLPYAMAGSRYYLQYMIYTAALFKYLKHRLGFSGDEKSFYDRYVGGVRYIFVRGTYEEGNGVFSDRMSYEEFKKLEEIIG